MSGAIPDIEAMCFWCQSFSETAFIASSCVAVSFGDLQGCFFTLSASKLAAYPQGENPKGGACSVVIRCTFQEPFPAWQDLNGIFFAGYCTFFIHGQDDEMLDLKRGSGKLLQIPYFPVI